MSIGKHRWSGAQNISKAYALRYSPTLGWVRVFYFGSDHPIRMMPL